MSDLEATPSTQDKNVDGEVEHPFLESFRSHAHDLPRLEKMLTNANLLIGAYADSRLVGLARALTDFSYCCYLSDLAVAKEYQRHGIGRELVARVKRRVGDQSMLLLLSSPEAMGCYPRIGLEAVHNGWIIKRAS